MKVGDVKKHKAGGPLLAVRGIDGDEITCVWWNRVEGKFEAMCFRDAELIDPSLCVASKPAAE